MNGLINLLILYIIFTLVSSLFRKGSQPVSRGGKSKSAGAPGQPHKTSARSATRESQGRQPKTPLSSSTLRASQSSSKGSQQREEEPVRFFLPEKPEETPLTSFLEEERPPLRHKTKVSAPPRLLAFHHRRGYIQGIILSEILGPPVSKRNRS